MKKEVLQTSKIGTRGKVREWDTLFNFEKVSPERIAGIREFNKLLPNLLGMQMVHMAPVGDGGGLNDVKGMIIFLEGPGEKQITLEISLGGLDDNKIFVELYQ